MQRLNLLFRRKIFHFSSDELWLSAAADMGVCSPTHPPLGILCSLLIFFVQVLTLSSGTEVLMFRLLGVSCGWIYGLYSGANCFVDGRQFLLLEQATWTCYGCGLSLCSQLVSARQFLLLEQAIWSQHGCGSLQQVDCLNMFLCYLVFIYCVILLCKLKLKLWVVSFTLRHGLHERCGRVQIFCGNKFEKFIENLFLFWV